MIQPEPVVGRARETALSVTVPEAESLTSDFRRRFLPRAVARRVPAHITLLYPFVDADQVDEALFSSLASLYANTGSFDFALVRVSTFPAHVWLAPEPVDRFKGLIEITKERFPDCLPYGGAFEGSEPVPHLTIGESEDVDALAAAAERDLEPTLPLPCECRAVSLFEEQPGGTWAQRMEFSL